MTGEQDPRQRETELALFEKQKKTLDTLLAHGALSKADYEKSLGGLKDKLLIDSKEDAT